MKRFFYRFTAFTIVLILLCQSASGLSAPTFENSNICDIMIYADEDYFDSIDSAKKALCKLVSDNIEIVQVYPALFGFHAKGKDKYIDIIDNSDCFDAHESGDFEVLEAQPSVYETSSLYASQMLNIPKVHESSYTGKGTVVAVIDNGFDISHEVFSSSVADPLIKKEDVDTLIKNGSLVISGVTQSADEVYINEKIPFAFDYSTGKSDVSTLDNHGTHVAAIIGGNGEHMYSVAPDSQLLLMKVFDARTQNAGEHFVAAALEDAIRLGADVVNLSLGTYSGSESATKNSAISRMAKKLSKAGITVVCAAGNDGSAGFDSTFTDKYGIIYPLADMTDFGTVSHPAVIEDFIAVASAKNTHISTDTLVHKDSRGNITRIEYCDTNASQNIIPSSFTEFFAQKELEYVEIGGVGAPDDYMSDPTYLDGKIALVQRGTITFAEKVNNAHAHGAIAVIIYGNDDEDEIYMDLTGCSVPAVFISKKDGEFLKNSSVKKLLFGISPGEFVENDDAYTMSLFSSWGTTPEMTLKPDITSVGESIYSAVPGNTYASLTGTSMASPFISGLAALLNEKLESEESKYMLSKRTAYIKNALMMSAKPLINPIMDCEYSPRNQGAGLADIENALKTEILITNSDGTPALTLEKEDGRSFLEFNIENLTSQEKTITLRASVLVDTFASVMLKNGTSEQKYTFNTLNSQKLDSAIISPEKDSGISISANSKELTLTLDGGKSCSAKVYIDYDSSEITSEMTEYSYFTDGFLYASTGTFEGSVPFIGFEGDFNSSNIFDKTVYSGEIPFFSGNKLVTPAENKTFVTLGEINGINVTPSFSPNSDLSADLLYLSLSLLRNISYYRVEITDKDGNIIYSKLESTPLTKGGDNRHMPIEVWDGGDGINDDYVFPDGEYTLSVSGAVADSALTQKLSIAFRVDTSLPFLSDYEVSESEGKKILTLKAQDESLVRSVTLYNTQSLDKNSKYAYSAKSDYDGDDTFEFDVTDVKNQILWADITDFAMNTKTVKIKLG